MRPLALLLTLCAACSTPPRESWRFAGKDLQAVLPGRDVSVHLDEVAFEAGARLFLPQRARETPP